MMKNLLPHKCINFHYYTQNKPIAKMFIAIVNTCSLYSLLLFVPMVSTIKSQDSRAIQTQSKECI